VKRLRIAAITFAFAAAPLRAQTLTVSPLLVANGSTSNSVSVTCSGCLGWVAGTPGTPAFSVSGGTLVSQTVTSTSAATLVITPTATNNYVYITAPRVSGVSSPALAVLTVQPAFSAGQPFVVNGSTANVIALTGIGANWLTSSPTFALSGCATATKTAQSILTDTTATVTLDAGATDCTITITDPSTSQTTTLAVYTRTHWYVRADGGTRYSANETSGQCNGMADAAYPGSGTNQACAFNDVRFMWQDGSQTSGGAFPAYGWLMKGGDILTIRGSIADGVTYRIGWQTSAGCGSAYPYWGLCGDANDSGMPSAPSGIAVQHTVIEGGSAGGCTAQNARTQLHGGWGIDNVIYVGTPLKYTSTTLSNSDYVDFACLDITDFAVGTTGGDYALAGAVISLPAHDVTFTDVRFHGLAQNGILGTAGGALTMTDIAWAGNFDSGWESDQGQGVTGFGVTTVTHFLIEGNGCNEEYPVVDVFPYTGCTDSSHGGYGDGFGTASINSPPPGWTITFDQGLVDYNTQDGIDALHLAGDGSSSSITRTLAYGNMGQQFKIGGGGTVANDQIVGNCGAMSNAIPGFPSGFNSTLTDFCRAGNTAVVIEIPASTTSYFEFNTLYSQGAIAVEIEPYDVLFGAKWTGTEAFHYLDNVQADFSLTTPLYNSSDNSLAPLTNAGGAWNHNATYQGASWSCPHAGETSAICTSPGLTDQTWHSYSYGNMAPASGASAVVGAGVTISGITTDFNGRSRPNPPAIGAYELVPPAIPVGGGTVNGRIAMIDSRFEVAPRATFPRATFRRRHNKTIKDDASKERARRDGER